MHDRCRALQALALYTRLPDDWLLLVAALFTPLFSHFPRISPIQSEKEEQGAT